MMLKTRLDKQNPHRRVWDEVLIWWEEAQITVANWLEEPTVGMQPFTQEIDT